MVGALEQGNMVEGEQGQGRDTLRENQIAGNGIQGEGEGGTHGVLATKSILNSVQFKRKACEFS